MYLKKKISLLLLSFFFNSFLFHCNENVLEQVQNFSPNTPPAVISFSSDSPGSGLVTPGQNINITFSASDAHKNGFTADITSTQGFFGTKSETWNNDILSFTVPFAVTEPAINTPIMVTITLTDEKGATADFSYDLGTILPNSLPVILSMTPSSATKIWDSVNATFGATLEPNNQFTIITTAEDPQNDAITFQYSSLIGTFSPSTEVPTGTGNIIQSTATFYVSNNVTPGFIGEITVTVTDSRGGVATQNFIIGSGRLGPILAQNTLLPPLVPYISNNAFQSVSFAADANGFFQYSVQTTTPCAMNTSLTGTFIFYTAGTAINIDLAGANYNGVGSGALLSMPLPAIDGLYYLCIGVMDSLQQSGYLGGANGISIFVDNTPPVTTIAAGTMPAGLYSSPVTLNLTCTDATAGCSKTIYTSNQVFDSVAVLNPPIAPSFNASGGVVNGTLYADQVAGTTTPIVLTDGARTAVSVVSIDKAGSVEPVQTFNYTVDTTVPVITINAASTSIISSVPGYDIATLTWSTNRTSLNYSIKSGIDCITGTPITGLSGTTPATANTAVTSLINAAQLVTGSNTIQVCVDNLAGLTGSGSHNITRDDTPPTLTLTPLPGNFTTATNVAINCTDAGGSTCAVTGYTKSTSTIPALPAAPTTPALVAATKTVAAGTTQYTAPVALANATQTIFSYIAMDNLGNISTVTTTATPYIVETTLPAVTVSGTTVNGVSSALLGTNAPYNIATITWSTNRTNLNYTVKSGTCATGTPVANSTAMATPNLSGVTPATANTAVTTLINQADLGAGANSISICVSNLANSDGSATTTINKDITPPTISITPGTGNYFVSSLSFAITCSDNTGGSGCKDIDYYIGGTGPVANYTPGTTTAAGITANGTVTHANGCTATTYTLNYAARDSVLNMATGSASYTITDCIRVNLSMVAPATYTPNSLSVTLTNATTALNSGAVPVAATGVNTVSGVSFAIGDTYNIAVAGQPVNQICSFAEKQFGTITAAAGLTFNIKCVSGYFAGGRYQALPAAPLNYHLFQGKVTTIATPNSAAGNTIPVGIAVSGGTVYYAEYGTNTIKTSNGTPGGVILAGSTTGVCGTLDGSTGTAATFCAPRCIVSDGINLYVSQYGLGLTNDTDDAIRKIDISTGAVKTLIQGAASTLKSAEGLAIDGNLLYIADRNSHQIKVLDTVTGNISVYAGTGTANSLDGPRLSAEFNEPMGLAFFNKKLYIAELAGHRIRVIDTVTNTVNTLTGILSGTTGGYADGPVATAKFTQPTGITTDGFDLFVSDYGGGRIRNIRFDKATGVPIDVSTLAGITPNYYLAGTGAGAKIMSPIHITTDGRNIYYTDAYGLSNGQATPASAGGIIAKISNNGLVGHWPLSGTGGNVNDYNSDGAVNNGSLVSGPLSTSVDRFGNANMASLFTGTQSISVPQNAAYTANSITVAAWIKPSSLPGPGAVYSIVDKRDNLGVPLYNGWTLELFNSASGQTIVWNCNTGGGSAPYTVDTTIWTHVVAVQAGTSIKIYANGKLLSSANTCMALTDSALPLLIGKRSDGNYFNGSIADVRIYNRGLNEGEINELAQDAAPAQVGNSYNTGATGLLSHYTFDGAINGGAATDVAPLGIALTGCTWNGTGCAAASQTAVTGKDGDANGAFSYTGTQYLTSAAGADIGLPAGNHPRTMCAWINPAAQPALNTNMFAVQYGNGNNQTSALGIRDIGGNKSVSLFGVNNDAYFLYTLPLNTWSHLCATYSGGTTVNFYVNGSSLGSATLGPLGGALNTATGALNSSLIIAAYNGSLFPFNGKIDDVRIYNNALSANQIRQLAVQVPAGLVARYDFTDNDGALTTDEYNDVSGWGGSAAFSIVGTGTPAAANDRFGTASTARLFSGANSLSVSASIFPTLKQPRTICAWGNPTANSGTNYMMGYGAPTISQGQGLAVVQATASTGYIGYGDDVYSLGLNLNTWKHYCGTFDGTNAIFYINGVATSAPVLKSAWSTTASTTMEIGNFPTTSQYWTGSIDDVRVYNRVLTQQEIAAMQ